MKCGIFNKLSDSGVNLFIFFKSIFGIPEIIFIISHLSLSLLYVLNFFFIFFAVFLFVIIRNLSIGSEKYIKILFFILNIEFSFLGKNLNNLISFLQDLLPITPSKVFFFF